MSGDVDRSRSYNMSQIHRKNTKPEIIVRKYLYAHGYRYRIDDKRYPGRPDIVLPKYRTVIFINGCFWHGHENCKYFVWPKTNREFWRDKINTNISRDRKDYQQLQAMNWKVIVVWECELKDHREQRLSKLLDEIEESGHF